MSSTNEIDQVGKCLITMVCFGNIEIGTVFYHRASVAKCNHWEAHLECLLLVLLTQHIFLPSVLGFK